jgi:hypothetical protein
VVLLYGGSGAIAEAWYIVSEDRTLILTDGTRQAMAAQAFSRREPANTPDEFAAVIKMESEGWARVIRAANIKAEP